MDAVATSHDALRSMKWTPSAAITIVAGENGCGKSSLLRAIAHSAIMARRSVLALSGTFHDKFRGLHLKDALLSPAQSRSHPEKLMKRAIAHSIENDKIQLRVVSRVLRHCGYFPSVGVEVLLPKGRPSISRTALSEFEASLGGRAENIIALIMMLQAERWREIQWMDFDDHRFGHSAQNNLVEIIRWEDVLKRLGVITGIRLHLQGDRGTIRLDKASSGELSLITSLTFVASMSKGRDYILIDEPENSLHPRWQREYLDLLSGAIGYSDAKVVIASHSPLLVMSAGELDLHVQTLVLSNVFNRHLKIEAASLEEVLAEVFHTYTPRNHYLSKTLVRLMDRVEAGELSATDASSYIADIKQSGVDERQTEALDAVSILVDKMAEEE